MALSKLGIAALSLLGGGGAGYAGTKKGQKFLFGDEGGFDQVSNLQGGQQDLLMQLLGGLGGEGGAQESGLNLLQQLLSGDDEAFSQFEDPFKRQFQQETVPGIAERFAGLGSHGSQNSSAMNLSLGQAGKELSESLASLRGGLQQNALGQLQGLLNTGMRPTFENVYRQPTQGFLGGLLGGAGQGAGQMATQYGMKRLGVG